MLNVFHIRPSDNGYYGIAEALLDQPRNDVRIRTSLFRSTQFPLSYPLPKRLDRDMQGWYGLQAYDLVVLAGVDPEVLSPKEMRDLVAFVEHGGGLLIVGGVVFGSRRIGTWEPLHAVLPVSFLAQDDVTVNTPAEAVQEHPITRGIPPIRGRVQSVHAVQPVDGATVLMRVGSHPLLIARECGRGRVLFLNSYPQCSATRDDCLFTDRFFGDLVRQMVQWLTHGESEHGFTSLSAPEAATPGGRFRIAAQLDVADEAVVTVALKDSGQTLCSASEEAGKGGPVQIALKVPAIAELPRCLRATVEAHDKSGTLLAWRSFPVELRPAVELRLEFKAGVQALAPGMQLAALPTLIDRRRSKGQLVFSAEVVDPGGQVIHTWTKLPAEGRPLRWTLANVCSGRYAVRAAVREASNQEPLCTCEAFFHVVDPQENEQYFPLVTEAFAANGPVTANADDLRRMIDDASEHGFNALNLGGTEFSEPLTNADRIRRSGEQHAQSRGLRLVTSGHLVPSFSRSEPPDVCVFDPKFDRALRERVGPQLKRGKLIPRLFMSEILDEPLIAGPMICRCKRCLSAFKTQFGYDMPAWEDTCAPGRESQRTDLLAFVSEYWREIFRRSYEFKQKSGAAFDVHHTFCQLTFGSFCSRYYWRDGFAWMPYCDRFDWDTYPYIYPIWRAHLELRCPNLRYHFAGHRALARHFSKPMGHWLDLSDRNVPHWTPPVRASSELVYTAIGQDTKLIRTFWNLTFGRNNGVRRERWDDLGGELRKINRFSSLLTVVHKPYARLAMLFGATDWALRHHTGPKDLPPGTPIGDFPLKWDDAPFDDLFPFAGTPYNAYELLLRAFGEAEILPEQLAASGGLKQHRALALWRVRYLRKDAARRIAEFVRKGGLLLCDGVPDRDERGKPLAEFRDLFGRDFRPICDEVAVAGLRVGEGETLLFNRDVNEVYTNAVLSGDEGMRRALKATIREFIHSHAILPHARPTNTEFEVNVLAGQDCFLLVVVNHNERDDETLVELLDPPSETGFIVDLTGKGDFEAERGGEFLNLHVALGERRGAIFAIYPERPTQNAVKLAAETFLRGGTLEYEVRVLNEAGRPAKGHHPVEIIVRDPVGSVRTRYGGQRATTAGLYRREVALATNERPGRWTIEVRDPITRTISRQDFEVE